MSRHRVRQLSLSLVGGIACSVAWLLVAGAAMPLAAAAAPSRGPELIASNPGDHETLMSPPNHVTLTFDRPLGDSSTVSIAVSGPGPVRVERGSVTVDGGQATIALRSGLGSGDYMIGYLVARTGGGSVSGSLIFELQVPPPREHVTDPPSVIASALAGLESPSPAPTHRARLRPVRTHAPAGPTSPAASADADPPQAWWHRSSAIGLGAVALLVLAGAVVFLPGRRTDD